jgi:hypothetical protein
MKRKNTNLKIYIHISGGKIPGYEMENFGNIPGRARIFLPRLHDPSVA